MKQNYNLRFTLALFVAMLLGAVNVQANLKICEVTVTDTNKDDLTVIPGVSGTSATYNPDTRTLRLENATMNVSGDNKCIYSQVEGGLIIEVVGNNETHAENGWATIELQTGGTIQGSGTLTATNQTGPMSIVSFQLLTIKNCTVNAIGGNGGLRGWENNTLSIENANVTAQGGPANGSIGHWGNLNLVGCSITEPAGAAFDAGQKAVCSGGTVVTSLIKIEKDPPTGINELNTHGISFYPNPVNDILHIQAEKAVTAVRIYHVNGTTVAQGTGKNISEINLAHLPKGIYIMRVETGERINTMRIVKK